MYAYAEETVRRAMRAEYEGCTCGRCGRANLAALWNMRTEDRHHGKD